MSGYSRDAVVAYGADNESSFLHETEQNQYEHGVSVFFISFAH